MTQDGKSDRQVEHQILARKYRPQRFTDVVEQQTAVRALLNAAAADRLGSSYLFFGPRGVGKTTIARILAKRVNCTNLQGNEPCDECESCLSIIHGNSLDVIEMDGASNRGIQHIRELRENVRFQPMVSKKKVYIIDEVHMLTAESFNALLKTLEEPPPHVLFILATTEYNKIPETILSRCQIFIFRKVPIKVLQQYLMDICSRENISAEEEALFWVARKGDGSVRDSLSFLEMAITYGDRTVTTVQVKELMGVQWNDLFLQLTALLMNRESQAADLVRPIHDIFQEGGDLNRFIWEYLDFLRTVAHIQSGVEDSEFLALPSGEIHNIKNTVASHDREKVILIFDTIYDLLLKNSALKLRNSYETRILIEMTLYQLHERLHKPSLTGILHKINRLSAAIHQGTPYSPEDDIQTRFLGTMVDPSSLPGNSS